MFTFWTWQGWSFFVAVGTIGLAIVAVFEEVIRKRINRTNLVFKFVQAEPDCQQDIPFTLQVPSPNIQIIRADSYYVRFRVINEGRNTAEHVEVFAASVFVVEDEEIRVLQRFIPLNLGWSNTRGFQYLNINRQVPSSCDLFHILEPEKTMLLARDNEENPFQVQLAERGLDKVPWTSFGQETIDEMRNEPVITMDTIVKPNSGSHFLLKGSYVVRLLIVGSNTKKYFCHFRICLTDVKPDEDGWVEVWSHYLRVEKLAEKEAEGIFGKP